MDYYSEYYNQLHEYTPGAFFYNLCETKNEPIDTFIVDLKYTLPCTVTVYADKTLYRYRIVVSKSIQYDIGKFINIEIKGDNCYIYSCAKHELKDNKFSNKEIYYKLIGHFKKHHTFTLLGKACTFRGNLAYKLELWSGD